MFDFIASLLSFFYDLWPSYGGAIVLLTVLIMLVFSPLQIKSTRSMLQMQRLQPEIKEINGLTSNNLSIGQKLQIPVGTATPIPTETPTPTLTPSAPASTKAPSVTTST